MRVLITGATGYIGSRVARRLHAKGHAVVAAVRDEASAARLRDMDVPAEPLRASLDDTEILADAARAADAVVHLAFEHRANDLAAAVGQDRRVAEAFVEALAGTGKCLIGTTATGVVGNTGKVPVGEDHPTEPGYPAAIRREVEGCYVAAARRDVRTAVIRPSILTHSDALNSVAPRLVSAARKAGAAHHIGSGENQVTCVHVDDLADLYVLALEKAPPGRIYNGAGANVATGDVARWIGRALELPVASASREQAGALWGPFFAMLLALDNRMSNERARAELGWRPYEATNRLEDDIPLIAARLA
ncbi:3-beta hydroxysteroid dehydrogenase [Sorangium cellulosum]|uniref:3-beta hydroxysteroid dehydrogenase n=1 Tax=Sorangium cellulosum TaxID=56 RepID=A0A2L0F0X7_SORCE|nr:NAD-dependent epimerase/dehydratase family protein [Sorangium cellulosum]AUX45186.1 3-beta hydroxysteroid dehydrogenase [Sorangium cellulosum]